MYDFLAKCAVHEAGWASAVGFTHCSVVFSYSHLNIATGVGLPVPFAPSWMCLHQTVTMGLLFIRLFCHIIIIIIVRRVERVVDLLFRGARVHDRSRGGTVKPSWWRFV